MLYRAQSRREVSAPPCLFLLLTNVLHQAVDKFILGLGVKEASAEKRRKIAALTLHDDEWTRVRLFCNILQVCHSFNVHLIRADHLHTSD
jgi:hypothetical protein